MQYKSFMLPASGNEQTEEALNIFLRANRIVSVRTEFITGESPAWCVLVEYVQSSEPKKRADEKEKIDYRQVLPAEDFAIFSRLREMRKAFATRDKVAPFIVFTDEQLAEIARLKPDNLGKLASISGIGQGKCEKYGEVVLKIVHDHKPTQPNAEKPSTLFDASSHPPKTNNETLF